jgi:hypothetical protein
MRNPSNASGRDVERALHDSMIANATSNYTQIIVHSLVMVAGNHLQG